METGFRDVISCSTGWVLVDSRNTFDVGYETMVFRCDADGNVEQWLELDMDRYPTFEAMAVGHRKMIEKWKG